MSKVAEQSKKVCAVVANLMKETKRLEERWRTCSFDRLSADVRLLKVNSNKDSVEGVVYGHWAELAELIFDNRISEIYQLADGGEGLIND